MKAVVESMILAAAFLAIIIGSGLMLDRMIRDLARRK